MNTTIEVTKKVTTLINILTVEPENQQKLINLLRDNTECVVSRLDAGSRPASSPQRISVM